LFLLQAKEAVAALMASRGLGPDKQQAGSSKIFLRAGVLATFEATRLQSA
jgi:myosin heavy subunit